MRRHVQTYPKRTAGRIDKHHRRIGGIAGGSGREAEAARVSQRIPGRVGDLHTVTYGVSGAGRQRTDWRERDGLVVSGISKVAWHRVAAALHREAGLRRDRIDRCIELQNNRRCTRVPIQRDIRVAIHGTRASKCRSRRVVAEACGEGVFLGGQVIPAGVLHIRRVPAQVGDKRMASCQRRAWDNRRNRTRGIHADGARYFVVVVDGIEKEDSPRASQRKPAAVHGRAELHLDLGVERHVGAAIKRADVQHGRCCRSASLDKHSVRHGQSLRSSLNLHRAIAVRSAGSDQTCRQTGGTVNGHRTERTGRRAADRDSGSEIGCRRTADPVRECSSYAHSFGRRGLNRIRID